MSVDWLATLPARRARGFGDGVASVCSAHPRVNSAALKWVGNGPDLIEAAGNLANQESGYAGMKPVDFRRFVEDIARQAASKHDP
jgi:D-tagatose-1,6-bisphosphate aldolase subunit GatZ/KbaZ